MAITAVGQKSTRPWLAAAFPGLALDGGRVQHRRPAAAPACRGVYAGGDCVNGGKEVVNAVAEGKAAARAIDADLGHREDDEERTMADLTTDCAGIKSPNPFWLASAPPTNTAYQVLRAFDAGWGGAVWKTLGEPIVNVSSRYGGVDYGGLRMMGLNNIELITDRPLEDNLREIARGQEALPEARRDRLADGRVASARPGTTSSSAPRTPARTASS